MERCQGCGPPVGLVRLVQGGHGAGEAVLHLPLAPHERGVGDAVVQPKAGAALQGLAELPDRLVQGDAGIQAVGAFVLGPLAPEMAQGFMERGGLRVPALASGRPL